MVFECPKGTTKQFRYKKGTRIRLGGCAKKGRFIKEGVKEITSIPNTLKQLVFNKHVKKVVKVVKRAMKDGK